jgi:proteasome lid subunit RPN8/RPN11
VKFDSSGFEKLFEKLDCAGFDYVIVGWYHSHPGYGCFMSAVDLQTQSDMFREKYHVAIVIDPVNLDFRGYRLSAGRLYEKSFKVFF